MAKQEEEDKILLSRLGVTAANVEDIQRKILAEAQQKDDPNSNLEENNESGQKLDGSSKAQTQAKLLNKLQEIDLEIQAVSSGLKKGKSVKIDNSVNKEQQEKEKQKAKEKPQIDDKLKKSESLQKALVTDRLKSLKRAKSQIEQQLNESGPSKREKVTKQNDDLIWSSVEEKERKGKGVLRNEAKKAGTDAKNKVKVVSYREDTDFDAVLDAAGFMETEREKQVRKGLLTPFHSLKGFEKKRVQLLDTPPSINRPKPGTIAKKPGTDAKKKIRIVSYSEDTEFDAILDAASSSKKKPPKQRVQLPDRPSITQPLSAPPSLIDPAEAESIARLNKSMAEIAQSRHSTKLMDPGDLPRLDPPTAPFQRGGVRERREERKRGKRRIRRPMPDKKWRKEKIGGDVSDEEEDTSATESDEEEPEPDIVLEGGLKIPSKIYNILFDYQKIGVQWMWELHCQKSGGIIGDEMGLGKTVQVLSFLASLHNSGFYKPSIVVCPVTLLKQWKREAEKWYPDFTVEILHDSAYQSNGRKKSDSDDDESEFYESEEEEEESARKKKGVKRDPKKWDQLINRVLNSDSGLLLTTYEQLRILGAKLIDVNWGYAILDEGHKIRNPNAEITLICKQLRTMHRIIMSGAPIQNKLSELWSLFDFVFPGKLGVLPVFEAEFSVPITVGGYVNANPLQVSTAYRCAVVLRDLVMPYLLRRMKADVDAQLPNKTETVLFCSLTPEQRKKYKSFLASSDVEQIFDGRRKSFAGLDVLKKICNHPDLLERETSENDPDYGNVERSGKMKLVEHVLKLWKEQGNKVLLFAQTQQMLDILENFLILQGYVYRRLDGSTPVKQRMPLIDEFNNSDEIFIFILTTKVGGLGTNLVGANRVIIYDPDWNPSTDAQARERAWRIGQKRDVTIYRLVTKGTIEEKMYQRQIYKGYLTDKVLKGPRQKRVFKCRDMRDLFTLQDETETTETSNIFSQLSQDVNVGIDSKKHEISKGKEKLIEEEEDEEEEERERAADGAGGESSILESLFNANGIHSAMNHDAILNMNDDQKLGMEREANQVAHRAAEAVRQSRMDRVDEDFSVPTWTGRAGSAGAPASVRRRFGSAVDPSGGVGRSRLGVVSPEASKRRVGVGLGVASRRVMSSSEVLSRIRGTNERAVSHAREPVNVRMAGRGLVSGLPAGNRVSEASRRVVSGLSAGNRVSEASRRRVVSGLPAGGRVSGGSRRTVGTVVPTGTGGVNRRDSAEGSSRVPVRLPAGAQIGRRSEGGLSSEASRRRVPPGLSTGPGNSGIITNRGEPSGASRKRVLPALPAGGQPKRVRLNEGGLSSDSSEPSRRRVPSVLPVGARNNRDTNGGHISSDSCEPSRRRLLAALPVDGRDLHSDSSEASRKMALRAVPVGAQTTGTNGRGLSEADRRRMIKSLPTSGRKGLTTLPVGAPNGGKNGGVLSSDSSQGSRSRLPTALQVGAPIRGKNGGVLSSNIPEGSRSRPPTTLQVGAPTRGKNGGALSWDIPEGSRSGPRTALPVEALTQGKSGGDLPSDSSKDSRSKLPMAAPFGGKNGVVLSSDPSTDSRIELPTALPVGAPIGGKSGGDLTSDSSVGSRSKLGTALPIAAPTGGTTRRDLSSDSSKDSRRKLPMAALIGAPIGGTNRGDLSSDCSKGSRDRVLMPVPVRAKDPNGKDVPLADLGNGVSVRVQKNLAPAPLAHPEASGSIALPAVPRWGQWDKFADLASGVSVRVQKNLAPAMLAHPEASGSGALPAVLRWGQWEMN